MGTFGDRWVFPVLHWADLRSNPGGSRRNSSLMNPSIPSRTHAPDMCNPIRKVRDEQGAITWSMVPSKSSPAPPPLDSSSPLLEIFRPMIQQHQQTRSGKAVFGICKMFDVTISSILNLAGWMGFCVSYEVDYFFFIPPTFSHFI